MTELRALGLLSGAATVLIAGWTTGMQLLGAPFEVIALVPMLVLVGGSFVMGHVAAHNAPSHRSPRDE